MFIFLTTWELHEGYPDREPEPWSDEYLNITHITKMLPIGEYKCGGETVRLYKVVFTRGNSIVIDSGDVKRIAKIGGLDG